MQTFFSFAFTLFVSEDDIKTNVVEVYILQLQFDIF